MVIETTLNPQMKEGWKQASADEFGADFGLVQINKMLSCIYETHFLER